MATWSTTFTHPYSIARGFSTIDSRTRGRAGWNIVTSYEKGEARNHGMAVVLSPPERYDRAEEV